MAKPEHSSDSASVLAGSQVLRAWWGRLRGSLAKKRILGEGAWVAFGQLASALGMLAGIRLLTEFVPPNVFGTVSLLVGVATLGSNAFCAPQLQAALRFYPDMKQKQETHYLRRILGRNLFWTVLLVSGLILLGGAACALWTDLSYWAFLALASLITFQAFRTFETNLLTAARRQRPFAIWHAVETCAQPAVAVLVVLVLGAVPEAVLLGYSVAVGGGLVLFPLFIRREGRIKTSQELAGKVAHLNLAREIRRYALPLIPLAIVGWVSSLSDRYIIAGLIGTEAVGVYAAAYSLISRPFLMVARIIRATLRPVYFNAVSAGNKSLERRIFRIWLLITVGICTLGVVAAFFLSDWIAHLLLAEKYRSATAFMPWIAIGYAFLVHSSVAEQACYAHKRTGWVTIIQSCGAIACLLIALPAVYMYGPSGAAISVPLYFGVQVVISFFAKTRIERKQ